MLLNALSVADKFSIGGITAVVGLLMTFIMLAVLIGFVFLMNVIIKNSKVWQEKLNSKFKKKKSTAEPSSLIGEEKQIAAEKKSELIDEQTLQAINSAVKDYMSLGESGKIHSDYTIKHIEKI